MPNVLSRNFPEMLPDPSSSSGDSLAFKIVHSPPVSLLYNGHFAVYVFFVLSGYVLALSWHQQDKKRSPKLSPFEQLLPSSHFDAYERLEEEVSSSSSRAPPPHIPSVAHSSSAAARRSTPDGEESTTRRVIILRRLWGRFWRLHIPAAASVAFSYPLQLVGAYDHRDTTLRPEITSYWASTFPPNSAPLSRVAAALLGSEILYGTYELNSVMYGLPGRKTLEREKNKEKKQERKKSCSSSALSRPRPLSFSFPRPPLTLNPI